MPLLTELVFLCNGSAWKGVPGNLSYSVLSNSVARAVASFTTHYLSTAPLSRLTPLTTFTPFTFHLSLFTFHFSQILALKDSRPFRPRYIESGLQPLNVSRFAFHFLTLSPPTVPSLRDSACVIILPIRRLHRRLPICRY